MNRQENIYSAFRLKKETVKFLHDMKRAFEVSYDRPMTNDEFIRKAFASVEEGDPAVHEVYCKITLTDEELKQLADEIRNNQ